MIAYAINSFLQSDTILQGYMGTDTFYIQPYSGESYSTAPIIVYEWRADIVGGADHFYYIRNDFLTYTVYDLDIDRAYKIRERLIALLNVGSGITTVTDTEVQPAWSFLRRTFDALPNAKEGYYGFSTVFEVGYKPKA